MTEKELIALSSYIDWDGQKLALLEKYFNLLIEGNAKMNLTRIIEKEDVYEKHFLDSLRIAKNLDFSSKSIVDVGSGAGFPGIPLAIAFPTSRIVLVESSHKKATFLDETSKALGLENVSVINARAEELSSYRESFDVAVSRAVATLPVLLELVFPLVKVGGYFVAMKGEKGEEELLSSLHALKVLGGEVEKKDDSSLPSGDHRLNIYIKKISKTPTKYPRIYANIVKTPL